MAKPKTPNDPIPTPVRITIEGRTLTTPAGVTEKQIRDSLKQYPFVADAVAEYGEATDEQGNTVTTINFVKKVGTKAHNGDDPNIAVIVTSLVAILPAWSRIANTDSPVIPFRTIGDLAGSDDPVDYRTSTSHRMLKGVPQCATVASLPAVVDLSAIN